MANEIEMKDVLSSIEGVNTAFEEFKKANDEALAAKADGKSVDVLIEEKVGRIDDAMDKHQKRLDEFELSQKRRASVLKDADGNEIDLDQKAHDWAATHKGDKRPEIKGEDLTAYEKAFKSYMRKGDRIIDDVEMKALSVGTDVDGGYTVHPDMSGRIVSRVFETSPMRAYANVTTISTDALEGMYDTDEAAATWVNETATRSETDTPELGAWRIPVHELQAMPKATQKILDDSAINIEQWLSDKVADKMGRTESAAFVTGSGVNQPRGFATYDDWASAGVYQLDGIEQFDTGVNGAFAAAPNGGDVLIDAIYGIKAQYRANSNWFMNRSTLKLTRKLKDSDGAYLWAPGIAAGQPSTLMGYGVANFEDMADPATGSLSLAFGDMRETYQIVDRLGIRVLRDPYSAKPHVLFYTTKRVGGDVINFESLKLINMKA